MSGGRGRAGRARAESEVGAAVRSPVRRDAASIGLALGDEERGSDAAVVLGPLDAHEAVTRACTAHAEHCHEPCGVRSRWMRAMGCEMVAGVGRRGTGGAGGAPWSMVGLGVGILGAYLDR